MPGPDPIKTAETMFTDAAGWTAAEREAIVARAKSDQPTLGADALSTQQSVLRLAARALADAKMAAVVESGGVSEDKRTTAQKEDAAAERAAFHKSRTAPLKAQGALIRHYVENRGMSEAAASALAATRAAAWGTALGSLTPGRTPKEMKAEKAPEKKSGGRDGTKDNNPWKLGSEGEAARASFILRMGTAAALSMARAAGKQVNGHPLAS